MTDSLRPLVIGHRGAPGYRPEHTASSYRLAFALGVDAVEPDIVATKDGVLVLRHENEISGTTDVAVHPEFADRRATKVIDGVKLTGWFTEDFTWAELRTLRAVERIPAVRQASTTFNGLQGILRLRDLLPIIDDASDAAGRQLAMVAEIKHATYFESIGLPLDELVADELAGWGDADSLIVESFEQRVLGQLQARGIPGHYVYLVEATGKPADLVAQWGSAALSYAAQVTPAGLARLAGAVDGVSVNKSMILTETAAGTTTSDLVARAHAVGLSVYSWTLRAENRFLAKSFRRGSRGAEFGDWLSEFQLVMRTGIDGVFADQPDLAIEARALL
ncbi:MAG: glycerophosphodiester phosphodiesterase family protein [Microbacteriaceae bacterium]